MPYLTNDRAPRQTIKGWRNSTCCWWILKSCLGTFKQFRKKQTVEGKEYFRYYGATHWWSKGSWEFQSKRPRWNHWYDTIYKLSVSHVLKCIFGDKMSSNNWRQFIWMLFLRIQIICSDNAVKTDTCRMLALQSATSTHTQKMQLNNL